jgi:hypothetical protein
MIEILAKTVDICKSSIGLVGRRPSVAQPGSPQRLSERPSWENEILDEGMSFCVNLSRSFAILIS